MSLKSITTYTNNKYYNQSKNPTSLKQSKHAIIHPSITAKITEFDKIPHEKYRKIIARREFWGWDKGPVRNRFTNDLVRRFSTLIYLHGSTGKSETRIASLLYVIKGILRTEPILHWTFKTHRDKSGRTDFFLKQIGLMTENNVRPFWFNRKASRHAEWSKNNYFQKKESITPETHSPFLINTKETNNEVISFSNCFSLKYAFDSVTDTVGITTFFKTKRVFFIDYNVLALIRKYYIIRSSKYRFSWQFKLNIKEKQEIKFKVYSIDDFQNNFQERYNLASQNTTDLQYNRSKKCFKSRIFVNWNSIYESRYSKKIVISIDYSIWILIFRLKNYKQFFKNVYAQTKIKIQWFEIVTSRTNNSVTISKKTNNYHHIHRNKKLVNTFFSKYQKTASFKTKQKNWAITLLARTKWQKLKARFRLTNKKYAFGQTISPKFCCWPIQSFIKHRITFWFVYSRNASNFKRYFSERKKRTNLGIISYPIFSLPITDVKPLIYKVSFLSFDNEQYVIIKRYYTEPIVDFFINDIRQIITPPNRLFVYRFRKSNKQKPKLNYISRPIKTSLIKIKLILKWFRTRIVKNKQNERLKQKGNKPKKKVVLLTTKRIYRVKRPFLVLFYRAFKQFMTIRGKVITELKKNNFLVLRRSYKKHFRWPYQTSLKKYATYWGNFSLFW